MIQSQDTLDGFVVRLHGRISSENDVGWTWAPAAPARPIGCASTALRGVWYITVRPLAHLRPRSHDRSLNVRTDNKNFLSRMLLKRHILVILLVILLRGAFYFNIQGGPKTTAPNFSCNNYGKYGPILIMFSLLHSQMN